MSDRRWVGSLACLRRKVREAFLPGYAMAYDPMNEKVKRVSWVDC